MIPVCFELTDEQGAALAELVWQLTAETVRPYANDAKECRLMCTALTDLQLALEHAGFFPRPLECERHD